MPKFYDWEKSSPKATRAEFTAAEQKAQFLVAKEDVCMHCRKHDVNARQIMSMKNRQGTNVMALCSNCMKELITVLEKEIKNIQGE